MTEKKLSNNLGFFFLNVVNKSIDYFSFTFCCNSGEIVLLLLLQAKEN